MENFVAVDVETANNEPSSICAIGAVKVIDGVITERFYELVKPEPEYYFRYFTQQIHGIDRQMTENSPTFDVVWRRLHRIIGRLPLVAHNKAFDERCIRAAFKVYAQCRKLAAPSPGKYADLSLCRHSAIFSAYHSQTTITL